MAEINKKTKQDEIVECQTWEDLFNLTIDITKREIHCATLAYFKEIVEPHNGAYGIAKFLPIPFTTNQDNYELEAYFFNKDSEDKESESKFTEGKLYCIIFTDYNYKTSVETGEQTKTYDKDVHSLSYGIVLDLK